MNTETYDFVHAVCHCGTLRTAARRVSQFYDECLARSGLRVSQFPILVALADGALTINALADMLELDRTTAGKNLKPLVRAGLVEIASPEGDARQRAAKLTRRGRSTLQLAMRLWKEAQARFEGSLGTGESAALRTTLGGLKEARL